MATININGFECEFPSVPFCALQACNDGLGVSPRTHLLAWRKATPTHQIAIMYMLYSMYELGGIEHSPYIVEDNERRTIVLLEHPNNTLMQHIIDWLGTCVGLNYRLLCPYRDKLAEEIRNGDERIQDIDRYLSYNRHPLYFEWKKQQNAGSPVRIPADSPADLMTRPKQYGTTNNSNN